MKRQQAAEDAIAIGLRAMATGGNGEGYLPPGPIIGIAVTEPRVNHDEIMKDASNDSETSQTFQNNSPMDNNSDQQMKGKN